MLLRILLLLQLLTPLYVNAQMPQIDWYTNSTPPFTLTEGPLKNQGYGDVAYQQLQQKLSHYRHSRKILDDGNSIAAVKRAENACSYSLLKTEPRQQFLIFSKPLYYVLPLGVISLVRNDVSSMLDKQGHFVIPRLVKNEGVIIGKLANRSYGESLDKQLSALPEGKNVITLTANRQFKGLFKMMTLNRIDAGLGFAMEAFYLNKTTPPSQSGNQVVYYPIKDQPSLTKGYVGCHKGTFGQQVIRTINANIDADSIALISKAYQRWLPDNTIQYHQQLTENPISLVVTP
ncbi:MAG: hypothetical protein ACI8WB_006239 [Phenylobacterium sp.]|jgi:uncharacterized protein (TIGR02285 family)